MLFYCCIWLCPCLLLLFYSSHPSSSILSILLLKSKGNQKFSYCYVADAASGIFKFYLMELIGKPTTFLMKMKGLHLVAMLSLLQSLLVKMLYIRLKMMQPHQELLMPYLILKRIGWRPLFSVSEALKNLSDKKELDGFREEG